MYKKYLKLIQLASEMKPHPSAQGLQSFSRRTAKTAVISGACIGRRRARPLQSWEAARNSAFPFPGPGAIGPIS